MAPKLGSRLKISEGSKKETRKILVLSNSCEILQTSTFPALWKAFEWNNMSRKNSTGKLLTIQTTPQHLGTSDNLISLKFPRPATTLKCCVHTHASVVMRISKLVRINTDSTDTVQYR